MSIFNQAKTILKDLQTKATSVASNFNDPVNPQLWQNPNPVIKPQQVQQFTQNVGNAFQRAGNQPVIPFLQSKSPTINQVFTPVAQAFPRIGFQAGQSIDQLRGRMVQPYQPRSGFEQNVFGKEPLNSYQTQTGQAKQFLLNPQVGDFKSPIKLTEQSANIVAPFAVGLGVASNFMFGGGAKNKIAQETIGLATKAKTVEEFVGLLNKSTPRVKAFVSSILKDTKNPINTVEDFFNQAKGGKPNAVEAGLYDTNYLGNKNGYNFKIDDAQNPHFASVFSSEGKVIGRLYLSADNVGGKKMLHIDGIEVDKAHQGQGLATELLKRVEGAIKNTDYDGIIARHETITNKKEIPRIFNKLGYQDIGEGIGLGKITRVAQPTISDTSTLRTRSPYLSDIKSTNRSIDKTELDVHDVYERLGIPSHVDKPLPLMPKEVTVYRAVTKDSRSGIVRGSYVTTDKNFAQGLLESIPDRYKQVISQKVPVSDLRFDPLDKRGLVYDPHPLPTIGDVTGKATSQSSKLPQTLKPSTVTPKSGASPKMSPPQNIKPSSGGSIPPEGDPVNKIIQALKEAKPIRGEQEALYSKARSQQAARVAAMGQKVGGERGYFAQLGQLKGELPKAQFEGIRTKLTSKDIDTVFQRVEDIPYFSPFEKITAKTGLAKLLGKEGGIVPNNSELRLLNEVFPPEFIKAAMGNRTTLQKIMGTIGDIAAVPRSLMAGGFDMSYGLRQGIFSGYRHPKQWTAAFKEQFKYFGSEKALSEASATIKAHPNYKLAREAGLSITDLGSGTLNPREEQFQSVLAEKIPGIGRLVRASGRAYTGFANKYRFDMFNDLVAQAKKTGDFKDPKFLKNAGELVNTLTGRGSLGPFERAGGVLSTTLFSPRLLASRLQLMNPQFYMKLQPLARKRALESLVAYLAGTATVLGAAKLAGADVSTNMTSSDFAKIKIGNTRVDIMGGFQQPMVLLSRIITGKVTSSTSGRTMTLGEGYKPMTRFDIIQRFFESKEAPIISFISSLAKGEDSIGNKFNLSTEVINRMVPMFIGDMVELYKDGGLSSLPLGISAFFGTGNQTYGKTEMVTGQNQLGQPTAQIRPIQGLGESVTEKVFGRGSLGTSSRTNVEQYYDQMLKMPKEEASTQFRSIIKTNPDLAKKIMQVATDRRMGITVDDQVIKAKGVASGDRAKAIADEMNKLKTPEEKSALFRHYIIIKAITPEVGEQLKLLLGK